MRIALAQIISRSDPAANAALVERYCRDARDQGAALVVFPEATMCAFGNPLAEVAEPLDGPWATRIREIADELGITIVAGMFTPGRNGKVRNTLLVAGPDSDAHYDKVHLFDAFGYAESDTVEPGTQAVTFAAGGATIGLATCYDIRFPALFAANADKGAAITIVCASWGAGEGKADQWDLLVRARAVDSTVYVLACDQGDPTTQGTEPSGNAPTGIGRSAVVSPWGEVLHQMDGTTGLLVVDLDLDTVRDAREKLPVLANRSNVV